ncbi:DegT/DnrJ/EryC1/StrS family aminotransferase [Gemmatimonadota bacterium]
MSDSPKKIDRRQFIAGSTAAIAAAGALGAPYVFSADAGKPAILGGTPVRTEPFPSWPVIDKTDERLLLDSFHSRKWCRLGAEWVDEFEKKFAGLMGVPAAVATNSGTCALNTALNVLEIGPGDEVITTPYTFVATAQVIFQLGALSVFADIDPETHMIDPARVEEKINPRTRAILPVHIGGGASDMDRLLEIGARHNIPVLEDACQAWMGEWRGRKLGSLGALGCFSFQASKNLNSGEGGAVIGNDTALMDMVASYTNNGRPAGTQTSTLSGYPNPGSNHRMTEFQGAILNGQLRRLEEQTERRNTNGRYLDSLLDQIPGIAAARSYKGQTRHAYHLYMMNYDSAEFSGLSKWKFCNALEKEGIQTISTGYAMPALNQQDFIEHKLRSRHYEFVYGQARLDKWREENKCPNNDKLCGETGLWLFQAVLLGTKKDMENIAEAVEKIRRASAQIAKA